MFILCCGGGGTICGGIDGFINGGIIAPREKNKESNKNLQISQAEWRLSRSKGPRRAFES